MESTKNLLRPCPICRYKTGLILHTQQFKLPENSLLPNVYDYVSCNNCGFCFSDTPASQADYDNYYNQMSKYEDENISVGNGLSVFDKQRMEIVANLISGFITDKASSIVDVGCANGGMLTSLSQKGFTNLTGIDITQKCIDNVKKMGFSAIFGGIFSLENLYEKRFDCLIVSHVMEHIRDLGLAAENLSSLINDDGLLYIEVPNAEKYPDHYVVPYYYFDCEHINHFNSTALKNLFVQQNMTCLYFEEKPLAFSTENVLPVIRAVFKKNSSIEIKVSIEKDEVVKSSIKKYIELSKNDSGYLELENLIKNQEPIFVWGAGMYTFRLLQDGILSKCNIQKFIDNDGKKQGNKINEIDIQSPEFLKQHRNIPVVIVSAIYSKVIKEEIIVLDGDNHRKTVIL